MSYIYRSLAFFFIGYVVIYLLAGSMIENGMKVFSLIMSNTPVHEAQQIGNIFQEVEAEMAAIEERTEVPVSEVQIPNYGEQYGVVKIPSLDVTIPLFYSDSLEVIEHGVGQNQSSSMPGFGCPILIGGHNNTYFLPLRDVEVGDIIMICTNYGTYEYEINAIEIHDEKDKKAYDLTRDRERLILYTCYPFEITIGPKSDRLYVYAEKISGPDVIR